MDTIKSSLEISYLFAQGKRFHTPYLTLIVLKHERDRQEKSGGRVAFIAGKKYGNAVWRNSAKRRMREVSREIGAPADYLDIIFLAKPKICLAQYKDVCNFAAVAYNRVLEYYFSNVNFSTLDQEV